MSQLCHQGNIETHWDEVQKITGEYKLFNISSKVNKLCNVNRVGGKFKFLQRGVVLQGRFSPENSPRWIQLGH